MTAPTLPPAAKRARPASSNNLLGLDLSRAVKQRELPNDGLQGPLLQPEKGEQM